MMKTFMIDSVMAVCRFARSSMLHRLPPGVARQVPIRRRYSAGGRGENPL